MQTIAQLKLPVNVVGFCGLVENMLGGSAFKLGDVLRARSGKTIEVLNTDAEGRLVLADVLDVALQVARRQAGSARGDEDVRRRVAADCAEHLLL